MSHSKKMDNIISMSGPDRYAYFVRKTADFEEVWSLHDDGWAMVDDSQGREAIPFWPERSFAAACCVGTWESYEPQAIDLESFSTKWLPGMEKDKVLAAVFPTAGDKGVMVKASTLGDDLSEEALQYE